MLRYWKNRTCYNKFVITCLLCEVDVLNPKHIGNVFHAVYKICKFVPLCYLYVHSILDCFHFYIIELNNSDTKLANTYSSFKIIQNVPQCNRDVRRE